MTKYYYIILVYMFLAFTLLCSCGNNESVKFDDKEVPDKLQKIINEQVEINAVITYKPQKDLYSSYDLDVKSIYNEDMLTSLFFQNESPEIKTNKYGELSMKTSDKTLMVGGYFDFFTHYYIKYLSIIEYLPFNDIQKFRTDFEGYPVVIDLQNFSRNIAVAQAEYIMETMEIDYVKEPLICAGITVETLNAFSKVETIQNYYNQYELGNPVYTADDEFYYMVYQLSVNDSSLFECNCREDLSNIPSMAECGSNVVICIGRNGILQVKTGINFRINPNSENAALEWISLSVVTDKIAEYFDNYILTDKIIVRKIDFQYLPIHNVDETLSAIPAWIIYSETSTEPIHAVLIFIDAFTGEFIYY